MTTKRLDIARTTAHCIPGPVRPIASDVERYFAVSAKLHQEAAEVILDPTNPEEYGDLIQALMDFAEINGIPWEAVERAREEKTTDRGSWLPGKLWMNAVYLEDGEGYGG